MTTSASPPMRSARFGLRATPAKTVLRRAADVAHKSLTEFILLIAPVRLPNKPCSTSACLWCRAASIRRRWRCWNNLSKTMPVCAICLPAKRHGKAEKNEPYCTRNPFGPQHRFDEFDCGKPALNDWLMRHARQTGAAVPPRHLLSVKVSALLAISVLPLVRSIHWTHRTAFKGMGQYPIPAVILARLAVNRQDQGRGIGVGMLQDAIRRTCSLRNKPVFVRC